MRKTISVTNKKVIEAFEKSKNASRLIEEAVLYYLDSVDKEYVTVEQVKAIIADCIPEKVFKIENKNFEMPSKSDVDEILEM